MAKHEGEHKEHKEHARKRGGMVKRARGGPAEIEREEEEKEHERAAGGGVQGLKSGGEVKGHKAMGRPDRKARASGGSTSDMHPETSAGKMTTLPFERVGRKPDGGGKGMDKD